ncbi:MAG: C10 family peptidase [Kiritimatiellae bacterium]|nr:C10 family peptidase [Kiritimatiellia bacterium]
MKKILFAGVATLVALSVTAREISSEEAVRAAAAWVRRDSAPLGSALLSAGAAEVRTVSSDAGIPLFHVVRMADGGTVVLSAESGVTPVIAFFDGEASAEDNPLLDILRADMANRLAHIAAVCTAAGGTRSGSSAFESSRLQSRTIESTQGKDAFAAAEAVWEALLAEDERFAVKGGGRKAASIPDVNGLSDLRVAPFLSTTWYQEGNAANYYTPPYAVGNPDNYPCGCVALVGAEIANYWRFPTTACPPVTNLCWVGGTAANYVSMGGTYDWENMPADFSSLTDDQKRAVGRLCYDFGVATQMEWGPQESGTAGSMLGVAFRDVFGYASAVAYSHATDAMPSNLVGRAILANLDAKCPVAVGLYGHEAVADGYGYASGTLYTHVNLGWGGAGNVWYNLPEVEVDEGGIRYSSSILDTVVFNIHPTASGELLTGRVLDENGDPVSGATVTAVGGGATVSGTTDAHGIYALRVEGGRSWTVVATDGSLAGSRPVAVGSSSSAVCIREQGGVRISDCGAVGNSWGNDIVLGAAGTSPILFVDAATGSDANDGSSWETAKASIQAAIDIVEAGFATNAVVLVNDGRYEPIVAMNDIPFSICSVNGPEAAIIDGSLQWARGVTNRCATLGAATAHTNTVLFGFTLTNGRTPTNGVTAVVSGGGSCYGKLVGCTLTGNAAKYGGGAYRGILEECVLTNNTAASYGGATYFVTLEDCMVADNSARNGGGVSYGSANRCTIAGNAAGYSGGGADYATLTRCIITNNTAVNYGGGAEGKTLKFCTVVGNSAGVFGGGAYNATLDDCTVSHNTAVNSGGGVYGSYGGVANGCTIMLNTAANGGGSYGATLNSCILWSNTASGGGGGASNGTLNNCTVANNTADTGGGTYYATVNNCIVWNNTAASRPAHYGATCRYSCLDVAPVAADDGGGNIVTNVPGFVNAEYGDFHLLADSPCIDAGTNEFATTDADFYGDMRVVGGRVDMGASEFQPALSGYAAWAAVNGLGAADIVTDGQPNIIRYVFDRPSGACNPFTGITFNEQGKPVIHTLVPINTDGVTVKVLSSASLTDWSQAKWKLLTIESGGVLVFETDTDPSRFYKLTVVY